MVLEFEEYQKMYFLEDFYWWFVGRRKIVLGLLRKLFGHKGSKALILDAGCGTGVTLQFLEDFGKVIGFDHSGAALKFCQSRNCRLLVQCDAHSLPFMSSSIDLITALDLLEHLEDDEMALAEFYRVLKEGGTVLITIPAYNFLWSEHDEALRHKRRYWAREVRRKVKAAGFKVVKSSYAIFFLFFPILLFRLMQRVFKSSGEPKTALIILPPFLNSLLTFSLYAEAVLLRRFNLPFGVSILCIAQKEENVKA